jgi:hypothetical protein
VLAAMLHLCAGHFLLVFVVVFFLPLLFNAVAVTPAVINNPALAMSKYFFMQGICSFKVGRIT